MDKRIEQRMAWLEACSIETQSELGKLWQLATRKEKQTGAERWKIAQGLGSARMEARSKMLENRLAILTEISECEDMRDAILILALKAKAAVDSIYDFDEDSDSYEKALDTINECTHMISMLA